MIESRSGRANLSMPEDVFRITDNAIELLTVTAIQLMKKRQTTYGCIKKREFCFPFKVYLRKSYNS
jgi:hypothetical protein